MKVANDYSYNKIRSAEEAVLRIRRIKRGKNKNQRNRAKPKAMPKMGNPEYKNTSSTEELEEMERQTLELLAKLDNGRGNRWKKCRDVLKGHPSRFQYQDLKFSKCEDLMLRPLSRRISQPRGIES